MSEMNLDLRTSVLEKALVLESAMNDLLALFLNVDREKNTRTFSNKSTSLSYKNKIDLLLDLDILTKNENDRLMLIMQFRNQFLHNINCSSFTIAVGLISGSGKHLLKFSVDKVQSNSSEVEYRLAFEDLYKSCLEIIAKKYKLRRKLLDEKKEILNHLISYIDYFFSKESELIDSIFSICKPVAGEDVDVINLKNEIVNFIAKQQAQIEIDPVYIKVRNNLNETNEGDKIKQLLT